MLVAFACRTSPDQQVFDFSGRFISPFRDRFRGNERLDQFHVEIDRFHVAPLIRTADPLTGRFDCGGQLVASGVISCL